MRILFILMLAFSSSAWSACTTTVAVNGDVNAALQNATGGDIVCLAYDTSGGINYVSLGAISKTPAVVLTSKEVEDNIAPFRFSKVSLTTGQTNSATGVTVKKMAFLKMDFFNNGNNSYISILDNVNLPPVSGVNSFMRFVGDGDVNNDSHNLIKGNTFTGVDAAGNVTEGRLYLSWAGSTVIENNTFNGNGCSDGIQIGGIGGIIRGNLFENLHQGSCNPEHVDAIQIHDDTYADDITIEDNIFRDVTVGIGAYGFSNNLTVRNNVFNQGSCGSDCRVVVDFGSASNLVFKNNYVNTDAMRVGTINQCAPSSSIEAKENVFTNNSGFNLTQKGGCSEPALSSYVITHNLYPATGNSLDSAPVLGAPVLASATPTILTDFALGSTSPGYGATPLIGITGAPLPPFIPPSGLVAWYKLATDFTDSSTKLNHGIANGSFAPQPVTDVDRGNVMHFDGNDLVTIPFDPVHHLKVGSDTKFTVCAWHRPDDTVTVATNLITRFTDVSGQAYVWSLQAHGGNAGAKPYAGYQTATGGFFSVQGGEPALSGVWQHICTTYDSTVNPASAYNQKIYVDGSITGVYAQAARALNTQIKTSGSGLIIGTNIGNAGNLYSGFNGRMADVMVFDRALTATEVLDVMNKDPN
jgi:hypothetical protein